METRARAGAIARAVLPSPKARTALQRMSALASSRPLDINVETTNFCPLRCCFCPNGKLPRERATMDPALFSSLCEQLDEMGGGAIGVSSMQSDVLSDSLLLERVAELERYGARLYPYSTTSLIGAARLSDRDLERVLRAFRYLEVSVGGLTRDDYRAMVGVDGFATLKDQLFRVADVVEKAKLGIVVELSIRTNDAAAAARSELLSRLRASYGVSEIRDSFFSWGGLIAQRDLPRGATLKTVDHSRTRKDCVVPWATLSVGVDGTVVGCGCVDWEGRHVIGDARTSSLVEIWNGDAARRFRSAFSRGAVPELCRACSLYIARDTAFRRPELAEYEPADGLYYKQ